MKQTTIPIKQNSKVVIKCNNDVSINGDEGSTLIVIVDEGDTLRMKEENDVYRISADSDCKVILPDTATVTVEKVGGDAIISNLKNRVIIGKIGDDLSLINCCDASIESVGGDCSVSEIKGDIEIARVGDSLYGENVNSVMASSVGCDVRIKNAAGKIGVTAGDEVLLHAVPTSLPRMKINAGNDIRLILPTDANAQLEIKSGSEDITIHAGGQDVEVDQSYFSLPLGTGGELISLTAGDSVYITDQEKPDWNDEVGRGSDRWDDFGFEINQRVKEGLQRAADSIERASLHAANAGRKASYEAERFLHNFNKSGYSDVGKWGKVVGFSAEAKNEQPRTTKSGPSDEERMMVLRMLQEKKITVEEAEKLLNALDK